MSTESKISFAKFLYQIEIIDKDSYKSLQDMTVDKLLEGLEKQKILSAKGGQLYLDTYKEINFIDLESIRINPKYYNLLPAVLARKYHAVIYDKKDNVLQLAIKNPLDWSVINKIIYTVSDRVNPLLADDEALTNVINRIYTNQTTIREQADKIGQQIKKEIAAASIKNNALVSNKNQGAYLVDLIITDAYRQGASDIHIETDGEIARIRNRVDGLLNEQKVIASKVAEIIFRRLCILANIDILKTQLPQDGSFTIEVDQRLCSIRLSILPTKNGGASAVLRISSDIDEEDLALEKIVNNVENREKIQNFLQKKEGLILVTGPTGSGKTTLLYSLLLEVNQPSVKIISVEDPVEVPIKRVCQVQVNKDIGLDFSQVLRSVLRQDPDMIMVGEIRDQETAAISLRAAITGHKVFSTLHAKNVKNTIERLLDLDTDIYVMSAALNIIIAQRLVRCLCQYCKEPHLLDEKEQKIFNNISSTSELKKINFMKTKGCERCNMRGYSGRMPVAELLIVDDDMRHNLVLGKYDDFYRLVEQQLKGCNLIDNALQAASVGKIDFYEVVALLN